MFKRNPWMFYSVMVACFFIAGYFLLQTHLPSATGSSGANEPPTGAVDSWSNFQQQMLKNATHSLGITLLQIIAIIFVSRVFGFIFKKIHQPTVIAEILAGIVLGPSLLGWLMPEASAFLFPPFSLPNLQILSQVGLVLFMFVIGMELDIDFLRSNAKEAIIISHASIVFPFLMGIALSATLYPEFGNMELGFPAFALFIGVSLSITAFPVLARIVQERGLSKTALGSMALTTAAIGDITAWCILAVVIAIVQAGSIVTSGITILLAAIFVVFMLFVVHPILNRAGTIYSSKENLSRGIIAIILLILLVSSFVAETIGIHALFGAFLAGVIMPNRGQFKKILAEKIEDISLVFLLPLFFVFTGLRIQIGLLNEAQLWWICALVVAVAVAGKLIGTALVARLFGQKWRHALALGTLMNTRGLMEIIVLNIGYDLGVLSPQLFVIMVLMALATTFMTGPALQLIDWLFGKEKDEVDALRKYDKSILMSFGRFSMGSSLLRLARLLSFQQNQVIRYTAMHITPSSDITAQEALQYEQEAFKDVSETARELSIPLQTYYKASDQVGQEIVNKANKEHFDLLLVGAAQSVFNENILGGKIRSIIDHAHCDVAVFSERGLNKMDNMLLIVADSNDHFLLEHAKHMMVNTTSTLLTVLDLNDLQAKQPLMFQLDEMGERVRISHHKVFDKQFLEQFDLLLVSIGYWHQVIASRSIWTDNAPSALILKKGERRTN
ncbi:MAG: cation:proton antiporter [Chitinophagales bacterium]|nr:cation:proton antiporter [Chitinophagales bacterium]